MWRDTSAIIAENLGRVRERLARAAERAGRHPDEVKLVAVTKYVGSELTSTVIDTGCCDLGESRPQQLWAKAAALADRPVTWHLIGPLQRNKVERTLPHLALIHSLDSMRLASAIQGIWGSGQATSALVEVNVSGDGAKHGVAPGELEPLLVALAALPAVKVRGLMTMVSREGGEDRARADFARLRKLRDRLRAVCPPTVALEELSMGMSSDFEVAVEEGATIVRVGSLLFDGLEEASTSNRHRIGGE